MDLLNILWNFAQIVFPEREKHGCNNDSKPYMMKKEYLTPDVRIAYVGFEVNFLASGDVPPGSSFGEDLDDPIDFDPWS